MLPHVCEFNLIACPDRYAKIAELMCKYHGLTVTEAAYAAIDAIRKLSSLIGIPSGLTELGVKPKTSRLWPKMLKRCMYAHQPS